MIVIADSNIFFASLIAPDGEIATILKDKNMQFLAPDYIIEEVKEHIDIIQKKRKKNKTERQILVDLDLLLKKITIIPLEELSNKNIQKIWSRDEELINGLTERGYGHFFISTDEVRKHLYKKKV